MGDAGTWSQEYGGVIPSGTSLSLADAHSARLTVAELILTCVRGYGGLRTPPGMVRQAQIATRDLILESLDLVGGPMVMDGQCPSCGQIYPLIEGVLSTHDRPKPWTPESSPDVYCFGSGQAPQEES